MTGHLCLHAARDSDTMTSSADDIISLMSAWSKRVCSALVEQGNMEYKQIWIIYFYA